MSRKDRKVADSEWHLDKRVPIALIVALMAQLAGAAWLASAAFRDIENNRNGIIALSEEVKSIQGNAGNQAVQLGRIEESVRGLRADMNRLLAILEGRT